MLRLFDSLVERLRPGTSDSDVESHADAVEHRLLSVAADVFDDEVTLDSTKVDVVGWDSLGNMNLVVALEDEFDVEFDESVLQDADAVRDLNDALQRKLD